MLRAPNFEKSQPLKEGKEPKPKEQSIMRLPVSHDQEAYKEDRLHHCEEIDYTTGDMSKLQLYREEALEWLMELAQQLSLKPMTTESAIMLFDRLLLNSLWTADPNEAQVDVLTVLFISIKLYEQYFMTVFDMLDLVDVGVAAQKVLTKEVAIMTTLKHRLMDILPSEYFYSRYQAQAPSYYLLKVLCRTQLRKYKLTAVMEALNLWHRIKHRLMKEEDLTAEQSVYVKYIDIHINAVETVDSLKKGNKPMSSNRMIC